MAENADKTTQPEPPEAPLLPAKIKLVHAHGFIDENGTHRYWKAGVVIGDPAEVDLLIGRKANFVVA